MLLIFLLSTPLLQAKYAAVFSLLKGLARIPKRTFLNPKPYYRVFVPRYRLEFHQISVLVGDFMRNHSLDNLALCHCHGQMVGF